MTFNQLRTCAICGHGMTGYEIRGDKSLCKPCAAKLDRAKIDKLQEFLDSTKPSDGRTMQQKCTCCPVHGRR